MSEETKFSLTNSPQVTIAIPTYNEAEHIEQIVNSCLGNTYTNIHQILIADGGSTDKTEDIVKKYLLELQQSLH